MKIELAKTAGFCFGVRRAVDTVYQQAEGEGEKPIYTYGPIIHNAEVVKDLEQKGVRVLETEEELAAVTEGTVIIRSHGVPKKICDLMEEKGIHHHHRKPGTPGGGGYQRLGQRGGDHHPD